MAVGPCGDRVGFTTSFTSGATHEGDKLGIHYISHMDYKMEVYAYRDCEFNDPNLKFSVLYTEVVAYLASSAGTSILGDVDANFGREGWLYDPDGNLIDSNGRWCNRLFRWTIFSKSYTKCKRALYTYCAK